MSVEDITVETYDGFLHQPRAVLIGWAESCARSEEYLKVVRAVAARIPQIPFGLINTDREGNWERARLNVPKMYCIPVTAFFSEGRYLGKIEGHPDEEELSEQIAKRYALRLELSK